MPLPVPGSSSLQGFLSCGAHSQPAVVAMIGVSLLLDLCAVDQILCTDPKLMHSQSLLQLRRKRLLDTPSPGHRACTKAPCSLCSRGTGTARQSPLVDRLKLTEIDRANPSQTSDDWPRGNRDRFPGFYPYTQGKRGHRGSLASLPPGLYAVALPSEATGINIYG